MQLSMSGKGNAGERGGIPGDLIIVIEEVPHQHLQRDGSNLLFDLYVNFADASLGTAVEIPTLEGKAKVKIEPGTQAGESAATQRKRPALGECVWPRRPPREHQCLDAATLVF